MKIFPFLLVLVPAVSAGLCPAGTFYDVHFKKCFLFHEERANFFDAEETCLKLGGHLVTIDKGFANWYIYDVAREKDVHKYWIGANRLISLNFQWTSKEKFNRRSWAFQAVESSPDLRCVAVFLEQWSIEDCNTEFSFVCEVQPNHHAVSDFWENIQEIIGEPTVDVISTYIQKETPKEATTTAPTPVATNLPAATQTVTHPKPTTTTTRIIPTTTVPTSTTTTEATTTITEATTTTTETTTPEPTTTITEKVVQDETTIALKPTLETTTTVEPELKEEAVTIFEEDGVLTESTTTDISDNSSQSTPLQIINEIDTSTAAESTTFSIETTTTANQELSETTDTPAPRIVVVNTTKVVSKACTDGWKFFDKWCYKAYTDKVSWLESTKVCSAGKANLVSIYSKEENYFVYDLVSNDSWIGLFDENGWDWIGSHDVTAPGAQKPYENWLLRVQDLNQGCAKMLKNMLGKWYPLAAEKCSNLMDSKANLAGFVCKKDAHELVDHSVQIQTNPMKNETPTEEQKQPKQKRRIQMDFLSEP